MSFICDFIKQFIQSNGNGREVERVEEVNQDLSVIHYKDGSTRKVQTWMREDH